MLPADRIFRRAKRLLAAAEAEGRRPFGWVAHSGIYHELMAARAQTADPNLRYLHLMRYRLFFSDALPARTLQLLYDEPTSAFPASTSVSNETSRDTRSDRAS